MLRISFKIKLCLFLSMNLILAVDRLQYAHNNPDYQDMVEMNGAVAIKTTITLRKCAKECSENDKCVTLFYNHNSGMCVIHSTDFKFQTPSLTELGWKHYAIRDGRSSLYLGNSCIVFENFTASIGDLMVASWVYWRLDSGASKRIFATMQSTIDAVEFSNTIQLSPF